MKLNLFLIMPCCLLLCCNNDKPVEKHQQEVSTTKTLLDSFELHFKILDAAVQQHSLDTFYHCCTTSIDFMEEKTEQSRVLQMDFLDACISRKRIGKNGMPGIRINISLLIEVKIL